MNPLRSTNWLAENINKVKILDATWHLPNSNRNALKEYEHGHIENSIFFDLDKNSNQNSSLPHMLPTKTEWEKFPISDILDKPTKIFRIRRFCASLRDNKP